MFWKLYVGKCLKGQKVGFFVPHPPQKLPDHLENWRLFSATKLQFENKPNCILEWQQWQIQRYRSKT
jgi:hypothetical protein